MQNAPLGTAGEALPAVTRRSFLRQTAGASAAVIATGSAAVAAVPAASDKASRVDALLAEYIAESHNGAAINAAREKAEAMLPAWAQPGPRLLFSDGGKGGGEVGWPELAVLPTPDPEATDVTHLIRPNVTEVWRQIQMQSALFGPAPIIRHMDGTIEIKPASAIAVERRTELRQKGFKKVREVIARIREKRALEQGLGLPQMEAACEASYKRCGEIEAAIRELASGFSPAEIAAIALFEYLYDQDEFALSLLRRTAPHLSGLLRRAVEDMISAEGKDVRRTLIGGLPPRGAGAA